MPELVVRNLAGEEVEQITVSDVVFGAALNIPLMHQAVVRIQASRRLGTQKAKTRGEVRGGGAKPWRQKGTGRARQGSRVSPLWRGGGVAFAPRPRTYDVRMPKKMRRQATRSALSSRIIDQAVIVVSSLVPGEARTKHMAEALLRLEAKGRVMLVDHAITTETARAARNLPGVEFKPASTMNIVDVLDHDFLVFSVEGLREVERLLTDGNV